jgi:ribosomal protein L3
MNAIIGQKKGMTQVFDKAGMVIPCTIVDVTDVKVVGFKELKKDG